MANPVSLEKAALYEKYRLPYAAKAVDDLLNQIDEVEIVADIGAGTGQLARLFVGKGYRIYAVEPDSSMRETALESLRAFSAIDVIDGSAEDTTLSESSVDLIVIGNAFHRFKPACEPLMVSNAILRRQNG